MVTSMHECLTQDIGCEGLLACLYGLNSLDRDVFVELANRSQPLTIDQIAETVDRERSTVYQSVQRLVTTGFARKQQVNYEGGSYCHVYRPAETDSIVADMHRLLNEWYRKVEALIAEFDETYGPLDTCPIGDET
ncbi:MAG: helix-turn-helix domain-containing protein [Halohasta sp.]